MTRAHCGLCEHLALALEILRARYRFNYTKVDIDADAGLTARYGLRVPVLLHGDREICSGHCEPATIEAYLGNL
jgi:hypothetical protein